MTNNILYDKFMFDLDYVLTLWYEIGQLFISNDNDIYKVMKVYNKYDVLLFYSFWRINLFNILIININDLIDRQNYYYNEYESIFNKPNNLTFISYFKINESNLTMKYNDYKNIFNKMKDI